MFKSSGIIRRIDESGRISLPNEIRRRYRLKDGDPVEIGESPYSIELRKYSHIDVFGEQVKALVYAFANTMNIPIILCDTYRVIATKNTQPYEDKYISDMLYKCMESNDVYNKAASVLKDINVNAKEIAWIRYQGKVIGALIIPENSAVITDIHSQCLEVCANAIGLIVK